MTKKALNADIVLDELARVAEIAAGVLDGEDVKAIITDKAMRYVAHPDPKHRYLAGDYYDVEHAPFLRTKKLLTRLQRLGKVEMNSAVWVPVPGTDAVAAAVLNGASQRYYRFGQEKLEAPPEVKAVFDTGQPRRVPPAGGERVATALAPVRDSLGDVVAVAEFTAPLDLPPPAWS